MQNQQQQINLDKNVTIEFSPADLSVVVALLRKGSFQQVAPVIQSIEQQVIKQVQGVKDANPLKKVSENHKQEEKAEA